MTTGPNPGGRWLPGSTAWARAIWAAFAFGLLGLFIASLPLAYQRVADMSYAPFQYGSVTWTVEAQLAAMTLLRLPARGYAIYLLGVNTLTTLIYWVIAAVIVWRRPRDWFAWYVSILLLLLGVNSTPIRLAALLPGTQWLMEAKNNLTWPLFLVFGYLFPNGRCEPRWMRWPVGVTAVIFFSTSTVVALPGWLETLVTSAVAALGMGAVAAQVYRYWRVSGPVERQQTKWVISGLAVFWLLSLVVLNGLGIDHPLYFEAVGIVGLIIPLALGVSILRYRLWDIDLLVRRTLIYAVLTGVLALAYFGSIVVLQNLFSAVTGQSQSTLVTVLSTLTIAALFGPLRARVQALIDQRLYRRKYDAAQTLAAFSAELRDETNLDQLTAHLTNVVDATMRPDRVSLWLRPMAGSVTLGRRE